MKKVIVLGATGSLGQQAIEVIKEYPQLFEIMGISGYQNEGLIQKLSEELGLNDQQALVIRHPSQLIGLVSAPQADIVINVLPGTHGVEPSIAALKAGKTLLLGNKESLFAEGEKIMQLAQKRTNSLLSLDSEHNAIFEILQNNPQKKIESITLPASGGPFHNFSKQQLKSVAPEQALQHPKWKMGPKITIESALLLNKGFEVIEAHHLFALPFEKIHVKIHPQCQIHGIVKFHGHDALAYLSPPNMREHIKNALLRSVHQDPQTSKKIKPLKEALQSQGELTLKDPDHDLLPGIQLTLNAYKKHHRSPTSLRHFLSLEEKAIQNFLDSNLTFTEIAEVLSV